MSALRAERERRGWSLVHVTVLTGIAPSHISMIERGLGYAWPGWRRRLSKVYGMSVEQLFGEGR